jgi:hypothetical protein
VITSTASGYEPYDLLNPVSTVGGGDEQSKNHQIMLVSGLFKYKNRRTALTTPSLAFKSTCGSIMNLESRLSAVELFLRLGTDDDV